MGLEDFLSQERKIKLSDDKTYTLSRLLLNPMAAIQEHFGVELLKDYSTPAEDGSQQIPVLGIGIILNRMMSNLDDFVFVVWQLMRKSHRDMTLEDAGWLLGLDSYPQVLQAASIMLTYSLPIPDEKKREIVAEMLVQIPTLIGN